MANNKPHKCNCQFCPLKMGHIDCDYYASKEEDNKHKEQMMKFIDSDYPPKQGDAK